MKKSELKQLMIVCNGAGETLLVLMGKDNLWAMLREPNKEAGEPDNLQGYEFSEFDEDLIHKKKAFLSITEVYDVVPVQAPFVLKTEQMLEQYKPRLLWEREGTNLSIKKLESFKSKKAMMRYIESIVPPYLIVE